MELLETVNAELAKHGATLLYLGQSGSKLYGTDLESSDDDYMGLFAPSKESLYLQKAPKHLTFNVKASEGTKNTAGDRDCTLYSVQYFFELLEKGDSNMVSLLYAPTNPDATVYMIEGGDPLDASKLVSKKLGGMVGYAKAQMYKYSLKGKRYEVANAVLDSFKKMDAKKTLGEQLWPQNFLANMEKVVGADVSDTLSVWPRLVTNKEAKESTEVFYLSVLGKKLNFREKVEKHLVVLQNLVDMYGQRARAAATTDFTDTKAMYHALRVSNEVLELHSTGTLKYPLRDKSTYLKIRKGQVTLDKVGDWLESNMMDITKYEEGTLKSKLSDGIDRNYMNEVILALYR